jgi:hypothetical protein
MAESSRPRHGQGGRRVAPSRRRSLFGTPKGGHGDRGGRKPTYQTEGGPVIEQVRVYDDGREVAAHRSAEPRRRRGDPINPAPGGGNAQPKPGAAGERERRRSHRVARVGTALGLTALLIGGGYELFGGNDGPKEVPTGPSLLDDAHMSGAPTAPGQMNGSALRQKLHEDVQRNVNNGEHGNTVTVVPGQLSFDTPDGQRVHIMNPIVDLDGLPAQTAAAVKDGNFGPADINLLDGRVFGIGASSNTPIQGQEGPNYSHGVVDLDVTGTNASFEPSPNAAHVIEVAIDWHTADPIAIGSGGPLEQNIKTGQYGQHAVGGNWQPMEVGVQPPQPGAGASPSQS